MRGIRIIALLLLTPALAAAEPPVRVVSLTPSLTAMLLALDAGRVLVGVDSYSQRQNPQLAELPTVGGLYNPGLEALVALAPGYADLEFIPPAPGSYGLPPLGDAGDGEVLDSAGRALDLHDLLGDRLVLLSFIYTSCSDVNGCPLATHVFARVAERLAADERLDGQVRLISLSFDPDQDSPEVMGDYGRLFQQKGMDWHFLTTSGTAALDPVLDAYGQWVIRDRDESGESLGSISHLLRVYLIDREKRIRNIYSVSFLHADTINNDLITLMIEAGSPHRRASSPEGGP